jgi:nucleotide-binding universal stress UspA family protein
VSAGQYSETEYGWPTVLLDGLLCLHKHNQDMSPASLGTRVGANQQGAAELRLDEILAPVDFSSGSLQALRTAARLAEEFEAGLHLLYVSEPPSMLPGIEKSELTRHAAEVARKGQRALQELAKREIPPTIGATLSVRRGKASQAIITAAARLGIDLIVLATRGQSRAKRIPLGSTAEQVIRHGPCPVLAFRKHGRDKSIDTRRKLNSILVPVDFSDASRQALRYAAAFARRLGATLTLLHVLAPLNVPSRLASDGERRQVEYLRHAEQSLAELAQGEMPDIAAGTRVMAGRVYEKIVQFAEEARSGLIIIGTHGAGGLKRLLIGSTAENVVRQAPCPVLVVRERKGGSRGAPGQSIPRGS